MHLHHSGKENVSFPFCHEAPPCSDARVSDNGHLHCTDTPDGGPTDQLCLRAVRAPAERPQNMPITPHESIAPVLIQQTRATLWGGGHARLARPPPPIATRAALAGARCPAQLTSFCPAPLGHLGKQANGLRGREIQRSTSCNGGHPAGARHV